MVADILRRGAAIYTMDPARPRASNVAIANGRIVACGFDSLDYVTGPATRVIDLHGRAVVPGFVDAHIHFGGYAITRQQVNLDLAATLEDGLVRLGQRAARHALVRQRC